MRYVVAVLLAGSLGIFALLVGELRAPASQPTLPTSKAAAPRRAGVTPHSALSPTLAPVAVPVATPPVAASAPVALSTWRGESVFGTLPATPIDDEPPQPVPAYVIVDGPHIIDHGNGSRVIITSSEIEIF